MSPWGFLLRFSPFCDICFIATKSSLQVARGIDCDLLIRCDWTHYYWIYFLEWIHWLPYGRFVILSFLRFPKGRIFSCIIGWLPSWTVWTRGKSILPHVQWFWKEECSDCSLFRSWRGALWLFLMIFLKNLHIKESVLLFSWCPFPPFHLHRTSRKLIPPWNH